MFPLSSFKWCVTRARYPLPGDFGTTEDLKSFSPSRANGLSVLSSPQIYSFLFALLLHPFALLLLCVSLRCLLHSI